MIGRRTNSGRCAAWVMGMLMFSGCMGLGMIQPSPWTYSQQHEAILKIVPLGTPRDDVVNRLTKAGIEGSYGISESIYYCDIWDRSDGARWHVNVALYFDESGNLYDIRPGQADTGPYNGTMATNDAPDDQMPPVYGTTGGRASRRE
ncbi:MAG: hypothetical protein WD065_21870 [Planctomycetaceae bacterium]